ncbi:hypothetical protein V5799_007251, partial [Amblyomma americanum]
VGMLHLMHDLVAHGARNEDDKAPNRREEQADGDKKEEMVRAGVQSSWLGISSLVRN